MSDSKRLKLRLRARKRGQVGEGVRSRRVIRIAPLARQRPMQTRNPMISWTGGARLGGSAQAEEGQGLSLAAVSSATGAYRRELLTRRKRSFLIICAAVLPPRAVAL
jgi:hypothetical protein